MTRQLSINYSSGRIMKFCNAHAHLGSPDDLAGRECFEGWRFRVHNNNHCLSNIPEFVVAVVSPNLRLRGDQQTHHCAPSESDETLLFSHG